MMRDVPDAPDRRHRFRFLLAALALLLGLQLIASNHDWSPAAVTIVGGVVLGATLWRVHTHPVAFAIGLALLTPALGGGWLVSTRAADGVGGSPFHAPFYIYFAGAVLYQVLRERRVTEDTVLGSACAYLLLSLAFASAYEAVEFFVPGSIAGIDPERSASVFSQLYYFSLVTLTTLGYGDMSPVHPFCQALAVVESVIGTMFPALVVARIIALQSSEGNSAFSHPEPERTREAIVTRVLFVFLPAAVLALPWLEQSEVGRYAVGAILMALILTSVYFVSGRRLVLFIGVVMVVASIALRESGTRWSPLSNVIDVLLLGLVVIGMSRWCLLQQRATTSVILASVCLYWIIGIAFSDAFQLVEALEPGTLVPAQHPSVGDMLYFSFMTLTTTGYGDYSPVSDVTRMLASAEAFIGIFYPAIVIARLVSLYGARD